MSKSTMGWLIVVVAGLLEVLWPIFMKKFNDAPTTGGKVQWFAAMAVTMCTSFGLLSLAVSNKFGVPIGTSYAVWTGLGAAGAAAVGILYFKESRETLRLVCLAMIIIGVVGIKLTHKEPAELPKPSTEAAAAKPTDAG